MACCTPSNPLGPGAAATDTCKRVNYTLGMLMGVDDFVQEQLYGGSRRRELAREVLGYGTVHGLAVVIEADGDKGLRVRVTPGMAWLPSGTPVCVESDQCANLNDWLLDSRALVDAGLSGSPAHFNVYLVLSHLQCLTDKVPIPGEPCRSDSELMQPSRIADSFRLDLRTMPPAQREEDALRDFVEWLLGTELVATSPALDEAGFVAALRAAAQDWLNPSSPPLSPPWLPPADYMEGSIPANADEALFRTALRLWATELRPLWMARPDCSCNATPIPPQDDAVLLARLELALVATADGWQLSDKLADPVTVDESRRPVLMTLRMLQELLLRWREDRDTEPGNSVVAETSFGLPSSPGSSLDYARADHTHGSPALPVLGGDLSGTLDNVLIDSLQGVPLAAPTPIAEGQVLTFSAGQWQPRPLPAAQVTDLVGDLGGALDNNRLAALQGVPLAAPLPIGEGEVLTFSAGQWQPRSLPEAPVTNLAGDLGGALDNNRLAALQGVPLAAPLPIGEGEVLTFSEGQWQPRSLPEAPVPDLAGDLTGPVTGNRLTALQGVPLNAPDPAPDQILRFINGSWVAVDLPAAGPAPAPSGQFVGRGSAEDFEIVAAGEVRVTLANGQGQAQTVPAAGGYGGLRSLTPRVNKRQPTQVLIPLRAAVENAEKLPNYIVKLTPIWQESTQFGFAPYLLEQVKAEGKRIDFTVLLLAAQQIGDGEFQLAFQVEVSRFADRS
ncbi:hypothetical protein [Roseateles sp. PN1]|uniref:hypothetical protein n=1 Tax=Roseateles sp. PN1 TaxID=3137372 RepID=UPI0031394243